MANNRTIIKITDNVLDVTKIYKLYQPNGTNMFVYTDNDGNLHIDGNIVISGTVDGINIFEDVSVNNAKIGITTTQSNNIIANNNKVGITTEQSNDIIANNDKVGITTEQSNDIITNNAKVGITTTQSNNIIANNNKIGITTEQINNIIANNNKVGITTTQSNDITNNNAKVGITIEQSNDIIANNDKVVITTTQANDITTNNAKVGITTTQSNNIIANNTKVGYVDNLINKLFQPDETNAFVYTDNNGNLHIDGNIYQNGSTYETHAEQLYTKKDIIITRDGATVGLSAGEFTGIQAKLYDGVNDGQLVFDNNGIARVGDIGALQPLATREESPTNGYFAQWDNTNNRFNTVENISSQWITNTNGDIYFNNGKVGIGTDNPQASLDIQSSTNQEFRVACNSGDEMVRISGTPNATNDLYKFGDIDGAGNEELFTIDGENQKFTFLNGKVGIGTDSPGHKFDVVSSVGTLMSQFHLNTATNAPVMEIKQTGAGGNANVNQGLLINIDGTATGKSLNILNSGTSRFIVQNNGNVGIGTDSPSYKLNIMGTNPILGLSGNLTSDKAQLVIGEQNKYGVGFRWNSAWDLDILSYNNTIYSSTAGTKLGHISADNGEFYWGGNVGIGTTSPGDYKLNVNGDTLIQGNIIQENGSSIVSNTIKANSYSYINYYGSTIYTNPAATLRFYKSQGDSVDIPTIISSTSRIMEIKGYGYDGANYINAASIKIMMDGTPGTNNMPGKIVFQTTPSGSNTLVDRVTINNDGNVLINTETDSGYKLDVKGTGRFADRIYADNHMSVNGSITVQPTYTNADILTFEHYNEYDQGGFVRFSSDGTTDNNVISYGVWYNGEDFPIINLKRDTQFVGINTLNPLYQLDVNGTGHFSEPITLTNVATPATPTSGLGVLYADNSDSKIKFKTNAGTIYDLTSGGIGDAAADGNTYGRNNNAWVVVSGGTGTTDYINSVTFNTSTGELEGTGVGDARFRVYLDGRYLKSYTETDPIFTAWDKSTGILITESQISDFGTYLTSELWNVDINDNIYYNNGNVTVGSTDFEVKLNVEGKIKAYDNIISNELGIFSKGVFLGYKDVAASAEYEGVMMYEQGYCNGSTLYSRVKVCMRGPNDMFVWKIIAQNLMGGSCSTEGSGGGGCFLAGTRITMDNNTFKNIEDIKIDDKLLTYDEMNKKIITSKVKKIFIHTKNNTKEWEDGYYIIKTQNNNKINVTGNHPIYTIINNKETYVRADKLKINGLIRIYKNNIALIDKIVSIQFIKENIDVVYNLEVSNTHNYFANNILVHNKCMNVYTFDSPSYGGE